MAKSKFSKQVQEQIDSYVDDDIRLAVSVAVNEADTEKGETKTVEELAAIKEKVMGRIREIVERRDQFIELMQPYKTKL
jgi:hypothetical protein